MSVREIRGGPSVSAPAFAILLPVVFAIFADSRGVSLYLTASLTLLIALAWIFLATPNIVRSWGSVTILIIVLASALSALSLWRIHRAESLPSSIETNGKVTMKRDWGKVKALLIKTELGNFVSYIHPDNAPSAGSSVYVRGSLFPFKRADAKSRGFDEYLFWRGKSAAAKLVPFEIKETSPPSGIYLWKSAVRSRITETLPKHMAGYMLALTVGESDKELAALHRSAGTVHLLSVSGFHVGVLVFMLSLFFKKGFIKFLSVSIIMWLYLIFAGLPAGGIRAGIMVQIYLLGLALGKPSTAFNSVSAAALLMLLWNPWYFFDVGWQLSVTASLFLSSFLSVRRERKTALIAASVLVWFVTAPIVAAVFKEVPIAGIFINIIAVPLFSFIFPCVIAASLPALLHIPGGAFVAWVMESILVLWAVLSEFLTSILPWSAVNTYQMTVMGIFVFLSASLFASGAPYKRIIPIASLFTLLLLFFA